jgi:hypothetical protein
MIQLFLMTFFSTSLNDQEFFCYGFLHQKDQNIVGVLKADRNSKKWLNQCF